MLASAILTSPVDVVVGITYKLFVSNPLAGTSKSA
jgi:hypothetical protein